LGNFWLPEQIGSGGAVFDFDSDGDMDIYLVQTGFLSASQERVSNRLYRNEGTNRFVDVTTDSGTSADTGDYGLGMGSSAADYDTDGDIDLYVTRVGPNVLLRNNGDGSFTDVTSEAKVGDSSFGVSATFLDYDRDGYLDLYVVNYVDWAAQREGSCFDLRGLRDDCSPDVYEAPALDIQPGVVRGLVVRGRARLMLRRYAEAELDLQQVAEQFPDDASNLFALGEALRLQGKTSEAIATYGRVLELQPGFPNAQKMLALLQGTG
jgi:tetratricopeptide (TPR) repeat protein